MLLDTPDYWTPRDYECRRRNPGATTARAADDATAGITAKAAAILDALTGGRPSA